MAISKDLLEKVLKDVQAQKAFEGAQQVVAHEKPVQQTATKPAANPAKPAQVTQLKPYDTKSDYKEALEEKKLLHQQNPVVPVATASVVQKKDAEATKNILDFIVNLLKPKLPTIDKSVKLMAESVKRQQEMTPEERAAADAEYRRKFGGQPAAFFGSKIDEGLLSFNQGAWNAGATVAANSPLKYIPGAVEAIKEPQNKFEAQIQANQKENQPVSKGQKIAGDVVSSTVQMVPSILASFINPALGTAAFGVPAGGQYAREAELEGAKPNEQLVYGVIGGAAEAAIEKVAFLKPLEKMLPKGFLDDVIRNGTANMRRNLLSILANVGKAFAGEAIEEAATDPITGLAKKAIYDKDKKWFGEGGVIDPKQMAYDALVGGITGGLFAAPNIPFNIADAKEVKKYIDENYDATLALAQGLPEEYKSSQAAAEYTKNKYPISYDELIALQKQVVADLMDYSKKRQQEPAQVEAAPAVMPQQEVKQEPTPITQEVKPEPAVVEPPKPIVPVETPKPTSEPRTVEDRIKSLENARSRVKPGSKAYDDLTKKIEALQNEAGNKPAPVSIPATTEPINAPVQNVKKTEVPEPETGKPYVAIMYHGKGKTANEIYRFAKYPIAGEGNYFAFDKKTAEKYGSDVSESTVKIENPIVIKDDMDWQNLISEAGWEYRNPIRVGDEEATIKDIKALKDYVVSRGHDGLIVRFEKDWVGDINSKTRNPVKTLRNIFGHDQAVVYNKSEEKPAVTKQENGGIIEKKGSPAAKVSDWVKTKLTSNEPFTFIELSKAADEAYGGTQGQGKYTSKDAYDAMELGINKYLLEQKNIDLTADSREQAKTNIQELRRILDLVPTQTKGNTEQQSFQQFSTPPTIAYLASWVANINKNDTMLEPSAGIGGIALFAKANGAKVIVNELSNRRLEILKNMPFDEFYNENAEHINDILYNKVKPTVVVMNPPFSATAGRMGDKNSTANAKAHIEQALEILHDGGRLVAITGQGMADKAPAFSDWWKEIKEKYNVRANIGIYAPSETSRIQHSDEYKKYGTDFGVQLIVIDKNGTTKETITKAEPSLENIVDLLEGIRNDRTAIEENRKPEQNAGGNPVQESSGESGTNTSTERPVSPSASDVGIRQRNRPKGETGSNTAGEKQPGRSETGTGSEIIGNDRGGNNGEGSVKQESDSNSGAVIGQSTGTANGNESALETVSAETKAKEEQINKVNEDAVYSEYIPQKLKVEGAKPHASPLVQSTAMASVSPPDVSYSPHIPKDIITSGKLSIAQIESIVYAGQQHNKRNPDGTRKAFFIGDGTGVGKGRQIAGVILDNWYQGRKKAIWVSKNNPLYVDAVRDWTALGGNEKDVFRADAGKPIYRDTGILFTTYYAIPQGQKPNKKTGKAAELTRIDQIINWVGKDFDGVLIFDESHMMQNLLGDNPSDMAKYGVQLQDKLPNARIVYASATGATEVENLAYAPRLGLWGPGTSFSDVNDFVGKIKAGGLAAMELVARDMKSMGSYIARNISFLGVKYDTKVHNLTDVQTEIYDSMAEGWQIVLQNMNEYLKKTGQDKNSKAKRFVMQNFWSTQQRFFNQILTSMQMPTVIEDMKKRLAAGEACVLQLVNTNAAAEEREVSRIEEEGGSLDDMDITPKGALLEMIDKCFPTQKYEEYLDDNGKKQSRPVVDSKGNPVEDPAAVRAKEELMKKIDQMQVPNSPMDMILTEFGVENVTEVTGRPRRFVYKRNKAGELERQEESRTDKVVAADVNDFLNDKKQILIFSDAGGTGKSYHAGKEFKNQRHRVHYLIQAGWNASKAVQGFGRTHRTNQVTAPEYVLVTTNLNGQKRFISSIARRLDQLGALTKGQRDTGSSGLFSAKDNLESKEARDALEMFYRQLVYGQIPTLSAKPLLKRMGLLEKIIVKGQLTSDVNELRDVTRFLNRILALKSEEQNHVFDEFMGRLDYIVEEAIRNDRLDVGLENYKSAGARVTEEKIIHKDQTGAETKYIAITAKQKAMYLGYKEITRNDQFEGFYKNKETGEIRAAIRAVDKTNADGSISRMYYMQSPTAGKRSHIVEKSFKEKWEPVPKAEEKILWDKELNNEPKFREEKLHLISGALLPIWNRLPEDHARVIRITTDDGNSYLGRLVPTHQIDETLRRLGVSREKETFDVKESVEKVLKDNMIIRLVDKTVISRSKVAGEYRLEIEADNVWRFKRDYRDIFEEKIGSKWRYFIPNNDNGIKIIEKMAEGAPILEVVSNRKGDSEEQGFTGTSQQMPRGDDSSTSSKTVDDLIEIIEKHTGVPIRTGKYRKNALGIFKIKPEVIRTKVRGDMPIISHELGHYLDKKFKFSESNQFKNELLVLGAATSKPSYEPKQIRAEGVAEFVRLYLTNPTSANAKAPLFLAHFEKTLDADTLGFLSMLRREVSAIRNLPNNKKIWNDISTGENRKSTVGAAARDGKLMRVVNHFYDAWINDQGIFAKLESYAEGKGWNGKDIDLLTQVYKGFEAKALNMLFDKQRDLNNEIIGDSLMEILDELSPKKVKARKGNAIQERKDFITYMVSRRAADYKDRGLVMPQPWYVYEDNAIAMEEKYPHFTKIFDGLREWEDNNLQLLVDSGIKTDADIEIIKYMNANHVPLYRIKEAAEAIRAGSGNTIGQSKNVIKRATGSGATIIDPLESMITDAFIIRRAAESNNIMRILYDMSSDVEGIGSMVEEVPPGGTKTSLTVKEIRKQLLKAASEEVEAIKRESESEEQKKDLKRAEDYKKSIEDLSDEQLESVISVYRPLFREKDNEVTVYVDGQKKLLQVDPEVYKAIKGLNREQMNIIMKALNVVKKVKQAGVVTTVPFVLRNLMRDTGTSLIQSEAGINPVDIIMGYRSAILKDEWYKEWVASGGATEYININERRQVQKLEDDVLQYGISEKARMFLEALGEVKANNNERTRGKLLNAAHNMLDIPVDMIRDAVEWSEAGARIAEFRKAVEKGVDKQTAAAWSRKLSVDFLRHGYTGKQVNMIVAFFNANVQGVVRIGETFKAHPVRTMVRGFIYITLPTMLLYFINRDDDDYKNLPEWRKAMFWNIPVGGGRFISIPKPPGWGWIFGTLPEKTVDKILTDNPEYMKDLKDTFWESFQFPTEVSAISPIIDVYADKQWNGTPIEGQHARENMPAYMIRDSRTSLLSSMIGDIAKNEKGLSPKQIDYLVKQYLGSVGDFFWRLPDVVKAGIEAPSDITQYPVIKSFITDAAYSSDSINDLYDIGKELDLRRKELLDTGKYPAMSHLPIEQQKRLYASLEAARSEYNKLADDFSDARKMIKQIKESDKYGPTEKKMRERALLQKMNKAAAEFNEKYRNFKKKYNIK